RTTAHLQTSTGITKSASLVRDNLYDKIEKLELENELLKSTRIENELLKTTVTTQQQKIKDLEITNKMNSSVVTVNDLLKSMIINKNQSIQDLKTRNKTNLIAAGAFALISIATAAAAGYYLGANPGKVSGFFAGLFSKP